MVDNIEQNNFQPQINKQVVDSISSLLIKVEKQSSIQIERIKFRSDEAHTLVMYDQINQIVMKSNNIFNLCIQQLRQELLNNQMEQISLQYQKIFNGLNNQLTQIISCQVQAIKYYQNLDKKQFKIEKIIEQKNQNKKFIPYTKQIKQEQFEDEIPLEQKIIQELQKKENQRLEKDKLILDTKLKLMKTENELFKQDQKSSENIHQIDNTLTGRNRNSIQQYSGAKVIYQNIQKNINDKVSKNTYNYLGLQSYEDLDEDDDNLSPFSKQKLKDDKQKKKQEMVKELIKRLQNGEFDAVIAEFRQQFEALLKTEKNSFHELYLSYQKFKTMLQTILQLIQKCSCGIVSKKDLLQYNKDFLDISQFQQKQIDNKKVVSTQTLSTQKSGARGSIQQNTGSSIKDGHRNTVNPFEMTKIVNSLKNDKNGQKNSYDKNGILMKVTGNRNNKNGDQNQFDSKKKKRFSLGDLNTSQFCSSTSEEEILIDGQPSGMFQKGKSKRVAKVQQYLQSAGLTQKLDEDGQPVLDKNGKPMYVDTTGNLVVISLDSNGQPLIDESGKPVLHDENGNQIISTVDNNGQLIIQPNVKIEGFSQKLDDNGKPLLNEKGQPIFVDSSGNQLTVQLDSNGKPLVDDNGIPVYQDINGNAVKPEVGQNGKLIFKEDPIGVPGFTQQLDEKGNPVLDDHGQAVFLDNEGNKITVKLDISGKPIMDESGKPVLLDNKGNIINQQLDKNGKPVLDALGKPVFVDAKGKKVILPKTQLNEQIPKTQKIFSSMVEQEVEEKFIMKNGKKIQVFQNQNGEFYQKDSDGNSVVIDQNEVKNIITEKKKIQVQQNFIVDKNGKKQEVKTDEKGQPYYVGEDGKKVGLPKQQSQSKQNVKEVFTDDKGKQYIIDKKTGKKQEVLINEKGQQYILNDTGKPEVINQAVFEVYIPKVLKDNDGNQYIINEQGEQQKVVLNEFGEQCIVTEDGYVVPLSQQYAHQDNPLSQMQQQIYTSETGEQFIMAPDGERMIIKTDDKGNKYFENKNGQKQVIPNSVIEQQNNLQPIFMNEKGDIFVKDVDGKVQNVIVDDFGQQFVVDKNGQKVALNPQKNQKALNFQVHTNDKGEQFIVNKKGQKMIVKKDKNGQEYVVGQDGKKVLINQQMGKQDDKNEKKPKKLIQNEIFKDDQGNQFIFDKKTGVKQKVQMSKDGKPYTVNEQGQMIMVNQSDEPVVETDEKGNPFVLINGKKQIVQTNKNGQQFFINDDGKEQIILEPQYQDSSSDESDIEDKPDYIDENGKCRYCGKAFEIKKTRKFKGDILLDENGERYIIDENGNKKYIQVGNDGKMFVLDENGNKISIGKSSKIIYKKQEDIIRRNHRSIILDTNQKSYDTVYRKFATDDSEIIEKLSQMDDESQEKLLGQYTSQELQQIIKLTLEGFNDNLNASHEIYELMRSIGANFKMSQEEFISKFQMFKKMHLKCGQDCNHIPTWYKKMFLQNQIARLGKRYIKMLKNKINPINLQRLHQLMMKGFMNLNKDNEQINGNESILEQTDQNIYQSDISKIIIKEETDNEQLENSQIIIKQKNK